ncbi:hypothetical protein F3Y22_tig00110467pilonHSYRG00013 [Hibiscus syriacus]|uniref:Uncharacterized protein n=1 Tax=Hibiscus syriacus TaxID=106335 RepID=A0A6A3AJV0_HIBSY|nr:hypothetical protein F3Y22_tig00110467pilonHSYRG00013 [Hibiscus syriacus]
MMKKKGKELKFKPFKERPNSVEQPENYNGVHSHRHGVKTVLNVGTAYYPTSPYLITYGNEEPNVSLTEQGFVSVCLACPTLNSVLYLCRRMSNEALPSPSTARISGFFPLRSSQIVCLNIGRECSFGDKALSAMLQRWRQCDPRMSSCSVSFGACKLLGQKMPRLNVEVIDENWTPGFRTG